MISCLLIEGNLSVTTVDPVFFVDMPNPTSDKPQSKLWFQKNSWWALLPRSTRPSLWQRNEQGWIEHTEIAETLTGIPGRADVWAEDSEVTVVGVGNYSLTIFRLSLVPGTPELKWHAKVLSQLFPPDKNGFMETATIVKDGKGCWYVSSVAGGKVYVWTSKDNAKSWAPPLKLADGIDKDDICMITPLHDGVGVIWSDQVREKVCMRMHKNGKSLNKWEDCEVIDSGNKTADDHLNASLATDGTLWLATKNSIDSIGRPQLVIRIRTTTGKWKNRPYANKESSVFPTRPRVITTEENSVVFTGYSNNNFQNAGIIFSIIDSTKTSLLKDPRVVISPRISYNSFINDITGPKYPYPANAPWIILASDKEGRGFEFDLYKLLEMP